MLDILSGVGLSVTQFVTLFAFSTVIVVLAYRSFVINIIDPLNMFIVAMIADVILMFGLDWGSRAKIEFTFFVVCFWIGFAFMAKIPAGHPVVRLDDDSLLELEIILVFAF